MPTLKIDGREVTVEKGTTVLRAAESIGITVPHFCYHPDLSIAGNCRMCLVEVEKAPKLQIACSTEVADGMIVHTTTERVISARRAIMEFLLINHPLDCPICDQAGECKLQEYSVTYGNARSRFTEEKVRSVKKEVLGPHVIYDGERCIKCTRCIRFCEEITRTNELAMFFRSDHSTIGIFPEIELKNDYSGNVVDLCPVGALTLREFRFKARVWDLKNTETICPACARGCNAIAGVKDDRVLRLTPRLNREVNGNWICDHGRLSYQALYNSERLAYPEIKNGGSKRSDWKTSLDASAHGLNRVFKEYGAGSILFIIFPFITNEDAFVISRLIKDLFVDSFIVVPIIERGEDDAMLIRKDKSPNRKGVEEILKAVSAKMIGFGEAQRIMERVPGQALGVAKGQGEGTDKREAKIQAVVVLGEGVSGAYEFDPLSRLPLNNLAFSLFAGSFRFDHVNSFKILLPTATWVETEGSFTNCEGFVQRIAAPVFPFKQSRPLWQIVQELGARIGSVHHFRSAAAIFERLSEEIPAFHGIHYRELAKKGVRL